MSRTSVFRRARLVSAAALLCAVPAAAEAQAAKPEAKPAGPQHLTGGNEGKTPIGWRTRLDGATAGAGHASGDTIAFAQMTPGFHVTTGPAAIMYHPDSTVSGDFAVESGIFLFPTKGRDREGYGMFVGGAALEGASQRYTYFLLRNDGKFLVKQRAGDKTTTLVDWTASPAIKVQAGEQAVQNVLRVSAQGGDVAFMVNGTEVAKLPRAQVAPDGVYGLRFNHAVNAHVVKVARGK